MKPELKEGDVFVFNRAASRRSVVECRDGVLGWICPCGCETFVQLESRRDWMASGKIRVITPFELLVEEVLGS